MPLRSILILLIFCALSGCSLLFRDNAPLHTTVLPLDRSAIETFSRTIQSKHPRYEEESRTGNTRRGPDGSNVSTILMINRADLCTIVLYSFDRKDSCVIFSDSLTVGNYEIPHKDLRVTPGYYIFHGAGESLIYLSSF